VLAGSSGLLLNTEQCGQSIGVSVCLLVTFVSPAKTTEPIKMPFGESTHVGQRNHVLDGVKVGRIHLPPRGVDKTAMRPLVKIL